MDKKKVDMSLAMRLSSARNLKGWTKTQAAHEIGVSVPTYSNWEYGNKFPSNKSLELISKAYGLSPWYILTGQPNSSADEYFDKNGDFINLNLTPITEPFKTAEVKGHPELIAIDKEQFTTFANNRLKEQFSKLMTNIPEDNPQITNYLSDIIQSLVGLIHDDIDTEYTEDIKKEISKNIDKIVHGLDN